MSSDNAPRGTAQFSVDEAAKRHLPGIVTLRTTCADDLDFRDVEVADLRAAIEDAYRCGSSGCDTYMRIDLEVAVRVNLPGVDLFEGGQSEIYEVSLWAVRDVLSDANDAGCARRKV